MKYDPPVTYQIVLVVFDQARNLGLARQLEASDFMALPVGPHLVAMRTVELEAYRSALKFDEMRREVRSRLEAAGYSGFLRWEPLFEIDVLREIQPIEEKKEWADEILKNLFKEP